MELEGVVQKGVIVPQGECPLADGTRVTISPASKVPPSGQPWDDLLALADEVERLPCDLPDDLAANHDHYLYGTPKRS